MTDVKAEEIREEGEGFFHKSLDILLKNKLTLAGMVIVALIILLGLLAAVIYRAFSGTRGKKLAPALTGALATLCHTALFMALLSLFFYGTEFLQGIAATLGVGNVFAFVLAFVGINGLLEIALAAVVSAALIPVLKKAIRS